MATELTLKVNIGDALIPYDGSGAEYLDMDLEFDYLIWTQGSETIKDKMLAEPEEADLNEASTIIDENDDKLVPLCLFMDYSHAENYYTRKVVGMGENKRYVFCFSFSGATANEPQLEAWDNENHNSYAKHVLGQTGARDSFVKAKCTTGVLPGEDWNGTAIAGSGSVVKLNSGLGALDVLPSGETSQELYANIKIVIPQAYETPKIEPFTLAVRFTWN